MCRNFFVVTSWNSAKNKQLWNLKSVERKGKTERNGGSFNSIQGVASISFSDLQTGRFIQIIPPILHSFFTVK